MIQKMDRVMIISNFHKLNLIPLLNIQADLVNQRVYLIINDRPSILRRKSNMVEQYRTLGLLCM